MAVKRFSGLSGEPVTRRKPGTALFSGLYTEAPELTGGLEELPIKLLRPYKGVHPFGSYSEERLSSLAESIRTGGLLNPILVRRDGDGYEILSGHNRTEAVRRLGQEKILCRTLVIPDDEAVIVVMDSNLEQREKLLPSEKAFAYKYKLEALKRQGRRTDLEARSQGDTPPKSAREQAAEGESARTVSNFIRLTKLGEFLLKQVDEGTLPFVAALNLSHLTENEQQDLSEVLEANPHLRISGGISVALKELSQKGMWHPSQYLPLLHSVKKEPSSGVRAAREIGNYIKSAAKDRPLSEQETEGLLHRIRKATEDYLRELE